MNNLNSITHNDSTQKKSQSAKVPILGGLCRLYQRPGSKYWWAVFVHKAKEIRTSTKQTDVKEAEKVAMKWYIAKQGEISNGFAPARKDRSFVAAAEKAIAQYDADAKRGIRSPAYVEALQKNFRGLQKTCIANVDIGDVNQQVWTATKHDLLKMNPNMSDKTIYQYRNLMNVVLNEAFKRGDIKEFPRFAREKTGQTEDTPRTMFTPDEYKQLKKALKMNMNVKHSKGPNAEAARELYDYVLFVTNTGLRSGETRNVRFCDVTFAKDDVGEYLEIRNIKGKRGDQGEAKSYYGAPYAFRRCITRHGLTLENYKQSDAPIFKEYHRDMFRNVLKGCGLYRTKARKSLHRDLCSLRSTYICFRLLQKASIWDIARNCRTSPTMIDKHYSRHLSVLASKSINQNNWWKEE